ncbi:MAG: NADH-quinone oxidoreductase subunit I, partial [Campylobacterales bacterium]
MSIEYKHININPSPKKPWQQFMQVMSRTFKRELFVGLGIVFREMVKRGNSHATQYPKEKLPIS